MAGALTIRELLTRYSFKTDTKPIKVLDNAIAGLKKRVKAVDDKIKRAFVGLAKVTAVAAGAAAVAVVKLASDAEESEAKFDAVFKGQKESVRAWSDTLADAANRSGYEIREMAAGLQDTFVPLGFARDTAAQLSKNLTELGLDVASFQNKSEPEVIKAFTSAIVGNHEAVRAFGITLTKSKLDEKIKELKRTMPGYTKMAEEQQKALARYNIILESTKDAHGDVITTGGSFANQMRGLKARVKDVAIMIGEKLLPTVTKWVTKATEWIKANKELIVQKAEKAVNALVEALKVMGRILGWLIDNWRLVVVVMGAMIAGRILVGIYSIGKALSGIVGALNSVTQGATSASGALGSAAAKSTGFSASLGGVATAATGVIAAFGAGFTVGTMLDRWLGLSDKISDKWVNLEKQVGRMRNEVEGIANKHRDLVDQAKKYAELAAKGVKAVELPGGGRMELTKENIQKRLAAVAKKTGYAQKLSPEFAADILKGIPSAAPAGAPAGGKGKTDVKVDAPKVTINMPPGTTAAQAQRLGEETSAALTAAMRRAMGDVPR